MIIYHYGKEKNIQTAISKNSMSTTVYTGLHILYIDIPDTSTSEAIETLRQRIIVLVIDVD